MKRKYFSLIVMVILFAGSCSFWTGPEANDSGKWDSFAPTASELPVEISQVGGNINLAVMVG